MKKFNLLKTAIIAGAVILISACTEKLDIHLDPGDSDTTIVNNYYYYSDSSMAEAIINYLEEILPDNFGDVNYYIADVSGECNFVIFYADEDTNSFFTDQVDVELGNVEWCNEGSAPIIDTAVFYTDEGCRVFDLYLNGELSYSDTTCPEILPSDTIVINNYDTTIIHPCYFSYDFNYGSTSDYEPAFENHNASESDKSNRYFFSWNVDENVAWTKYPLYDELSNTDSISLKWGSSCDYSVELIEESESGERVLFEKVVEGISKFDVYNDSSYTLLSLKLPKGNYSGKRFVVRVNKIPGRTYGFSRSQQFNITEIYVGWSWIE